MGYQVKWVQDNLGVSRKALRVFEDMGLMPKNEGGRYREYSEEDIDRIWIIRVFQGMGYSLKEIVALVQSGDFHQAITEKIEELERKKASIDQHLGYAQMIKLTGRFPSRPREMGSMKFDEFQKIALEGWNVDSTPAGKEAKAAFDIILNTPEDQLGETELNQMLETFSQLMPALKNPELIMSGMVLPQAIIRRSDLGPAHPEVQLLVKLLYEYWCEFEPAPTLEQFGRISSSMYMAGDIGLIEQKRFGVEGCAFLADAIAIFGGFKDYEDSSQH